jgi:site-specific DNA recombinase
MFTGGHRARVLGARRLSHDTEASSSVERQGETITMWSTAMRHTIVKLTKDVDISGATSPFDWPGLGPWLTEPSKVPRWDILAVASTDRISRSLISFGALIEWCTSHNK